MSKGKNKKPIINNAITNLSNGNQSILNNATNNIIHHRNITMENDTENEIGDVVLTDNSLAALPKLITVSKDAMSVLKMNIIIAIVIKAAILILGALGLVPIWAAIIADFAIGVIALINCNRIFK